MTKKLTKKQHYVPQFYLRNFTSDDNKLWVFDREKKHIISGLQRKSVMRSIYMRHHGKMKILN